MEQLTELKETLIFVSWWKDVIKKRVRWRDTQARSGRPQCGSFWDPHGAGLYQPYWHMNVAALQEALWAPQNWKLYGGFITRCDHGLTIFGLCPFSQWSGGPGFLALLIFLGTSYHLGAMEESTKSCLIRTEDIPGIFITQESAGVSGALCQKGHQRQLSELEVLLVFLFPGKLQGF